MRSEFLAATGAAFVLTEGMLGAAIDAQPVQAQTPVRTVSYEQVHAGPIPSEVALQEVLSKLGQLGIASEAGQGQLSEDDPSGLCPTAAYPDAGDVIYLGPDNTDPACTNNGLFANPLNNPRVCPNGTQHPGAVIEGGLDEYYQSSCGKTATMPQSTPTQRPAATPAQSHNSQPAATPTTNESDTTGSNVSGGEYLGVMLALIVGGGAIYVAASMRGKSKP
ncbi:MAG TPA: hypothetical protein VFT53_06140 [Candidatus Saccharimonadales bacterium]|nr:hypothetical protein [Candidatus Saccharimonadales bacterium]